MTERALAGLVALNLAYARRGPLAALGGCAAFRTWAAVAAARGARVPRRPRRVRRAVDGAPRRSASRSAAVGIVRRRSLVLAAAGVVAGRLRAMPPRARSTPTRRHSDGARVRCRDRTCGALPRGVVPRRAAAEPPGVRRVGLLGAEGQGDLLLRRSRRAPLHDHAERVVSASPARSSTPPPSTRWAAADVVTLHVQFWFLVARRHRWPLPDCSIARHVPAWLLWPSSSARARRASLRRASAGAAGATSSSTSSSSSPHSCSRSGSATRRGWRLAAVTRCCSPERRHDEARGHPLRRGRARRRVRRLVAATLAAARSPRLVAVGARRASLASLDRPARHRRRGAVRRRSAPAGSWGALRLSFDVLFTRTPLVGAAARLATIALVAAAVWGDQAPGRIRRARRCRCSSPAASGRRSASRIWRHRRRVGQPDRALHGVDRPPGGSRRSPAPLVGLATR